MSKEKKGRVSMRLIDADALDKKSYPDKSEDWEEANWVVDLADIRSATTISPAANWTPCSVALPESGLLDDCGNDIEYLVTIAAELWTGRVAFHTISAIYAEESWQYCRGGCAIEDDCRTVLAWQPMPEPYRGEE